MKYWVMYSILTLYDMSVDPFVSWLPFYDYIKLMLLLYMLIPQSNGATILYDSFAAPFLKKQEEKFATKVWPKIRGNLLSTTDALHQGMVKQCITQIDLKELERLSIATENTIDMLRLEKLRRRTRREQVNAEMHRRKGTASNLARPDSFILFQRMCYAVSFEHLRVR